MDELPPQLEAGLAAVDGAIDEVEVALAPLLAAPLSQTRTDLSAVESAKLDLGLAYSINSLFWIYLCTQGVSPRDHPVKAELNRIRDCMKRIKGVQGDAGSQAVERQREDARGLNGLKLNKKAAKRFIEAAIKNDADDAVETEAAERAQKRSKKGAADDATDGAKGKKNSKKNRKDSSEDNTVEQKKSKKKKKKKSEKDTN
eukprot:m.35236 g.35236  ORF g.35236 m.35236 type:complete len:201 (+) comp7422_c0_seq1:41-643(+)